MWILLLLQLHFSSLALTAAAFPEFSAKSALSYFNSVLASDDVQKLDKTSALIIRAQFHSQLGDHTTAQAIALEALQADSTRSDIRSFLANLYIRQDRLENAREHLQLALQQQPKLPGGYRRLAMILDRLGDYPAADTAFQKALEQDLTDSSARTAYGQFLADHDEPAKALTLLTTACELGPNSSSAFYALAQVQRRLGKHSEARETLKNFQELKKKESAAPAASEEDTHNPATATAQAHLQLATLFLEKGNPSLAERHLQQALRIDQFPPALALLASMHFQTGNLALARKEYETLVQLDPDAPDYFLNLGAVLIQLREPQLAEENFAKALRLNPSHPQVLNNLARLYMGARRELPAALDLAQRLVKAEPTATSYDLLAWAFYANGRVSEAKSASAESVRLEPGNSKFRERLRRLQELP